MPSWRLSGQSEVARVKDLRGCFGAPVSHPHLNEDGMELCGFHRQAIGPPSFARGLQQWFCRFSLTSLAYPHYPCLVPPYYGHKAANLLRAPRPGRAQCPIRGWRLRHSPRHARSRSPPAPHAGPHSLPYLPSHMPCADRLFICCLPSGLTELGVGQAQALCSGALLMETRPDLIVVSPLTRTIQTAAHGFANLVQASSTPLPCSSGSAVNLPSGPGFCSW